MDTEIQKYSNLGAMTLFILIFKRIGFVFVFFLAYIAINFGILYLPASLLIYAPTVKTAAMLIFLAVAVIIAFIGWLEYVRYQIVISPESIKINRGILSEIQIGLPFRRIKQTTIKRSVVEQILGISTLVVTILDEDGDGESQAESNIKLPALNKELAVSIQDHILKKAEVEVMKIHQAK